VIIVELLEIAKKRYSVRSYKSTKVEKDKLLKILEAGRVAQTAANLQPQRLIVVQEQAGLSKIAKAANIFGAPLAIIVCVDKGIAWKRPLDGMITSDIDASIVTDHMMLEATDLGLGSLWVCLFKPDVIRTEFNLPDNLEPVNILVLGYANDKPLAADRHSKTRLPVEKTIFYEKL
jgi:nitroreductase